MLLNPKPNDSLECADPYTYVVMSFDLYSRPLDVLNDIKSACSIAHAFCKFKNNRTIITSEPVQFHQREKACINLNATFCKFSFQYFFQSVTNIIICQNVMSVTNICHQHIWSPTSDTYIDVIHFITVYFRYTIDT